MVYELEVLNGGGKASEEQLNIPLLLCFKYIHAFWVSGAHPALQKGGVRPNPPG